MRTLLALCALCVLVAARPLAAADAGRPRPLTLHAIFAPDAGGQRPDELTWSADGTRLAYLFDDGGGDALWTLALGERDASAPAPRRLLALAALPGEKTGEEARRALDAMTWSPRGDGLLLTWDGDLVLVHLDGSVHRLTQTDADESQAAFAPGGQAIAFVRDHDLHLLELGPSEPGGPARRRERALTDDGKESEILNGETDWVYREEIWDREATGFWWSPDGARIVYYRFEEDGVARYPLLDEREVYPEVEWQRYPKAGTTNPKVRLGVLDLGTGKTVWLGTGDETRDVYLARVTWTPGGDIAVQRLARDQKRLDLLRCGALDGRCTTLLTETWPTWINLSHDLRFLADGRFVWSSERSGWRRLYLHSADGSELRELGPASGALAAVAHLDPDGSFALAVVHGPPPLGAAERQVVRIALADGAVTSLAAEPGWNDADAGAAGLWVHSWSDAATPTTRSVRDAEGGLVVELPFRPPSTYDPARLPRWQQITLAGPGGAQLPARLLAPVGREKGRRYPVVMHHYGGPGSQRVVNRWDSRSGLWHAFMAQRDYGVLMVDNPASAFFGKRGEDRLHRRFGELELAAQKAGVEWLRRQPWVDTARLGLWGWSGGGSNTLYSVFRSPGTWRAAVAGAPVTDWRLYDSIWTERYLERPQDNEQGYRDSSPITHLDGLRDALLVVHGTGDDNVHPQNTINLLDRLVAANKPHEVAIYPRQGHGFRTAANRHFYARMTEFFDRHLAP